MEEDWCLNAFFENFHLSITFLNTYYPSQLKEKKKKKKGERKAVNIFSLPLLANNYTQKLQKSQEREGRNEA